VDLNVRADEQAEYLGVARARHQRHGSGGRVRKDNDIVKAMVPFDTAGTLTLDCREASAGCRHEHGGLWWLNTKLALATETARWQARHGERTLIAGQLDHDGMVGQGRGGGPVKVVGTLRHPRVPPSWN